MKDIKDILAFARDDGFVDWEGNENEEEQEKQGFVPFSTNENQPDESQQPSPFFNEITNAEKSNQTKELSNISDVKKEYETLDAPYKALLSEITHKRDKKTKKEFLDVSVKLSGNTIRDYGEKIAAKKDASPADAEAIVALAQKRGWNKLAVKGTAEFKSKVWLQAQNKGLELTGYEPTEKDKEQLKIMKQTQENAKNNPDAEKFAKFFNKGDLTHIQGGSKKPSDRKKRPVEKFLSRLSKIDEKPIAKAGIMFGLASTVGSFGLMGYGGFNAIRQCAKEIKQNKQAQKQRAAKIAEFMAKGFREEDLPKELKVSKRRSRWNVYGRPLTKCMGRVAMYGASFTAGAVAGPYAAVGVGATYGAVTILKKTGVLKKKNKNKNEEVVKSPEQIKQMRKNKKRMILNGALNTGLMVAASMAGAQVGAETGLTDTATNAFSDLRDSTAKAFENVKESVSQTAKDFGESINQTASNIKSSTTQILNDAKESINQGATQTNVGAENSSVEATNAQMEIKRENLEPLKSVETKGVNVEKVETNLKGDDVANATQNASNTATELDLSAYKEMPKDITDVNKMMLYKQANPEGYEQAFGDRPIDPIEMGIRKDAAEMAKDWMQKHPNSDVTQEQALRKAYSVIKEGYQEDLANNIASIKEAQNFTPDGYVKTAGGTEFKMHREVNEISGSVREGIVSKGEINPNDTEALMLKKALNPRGYQEDFVKDGVDPIEAIKEKEAKALLGDYLKNNPDQEYSKELLEDAKKSVDNFHQEQLQRNLKDLREGGIYDQSSEIDKINKAHGVDSQQSQTTNTAEASSSQASRGLDAYAETPKDVSNIQEMMLYKEANPQGYEQAFGDKPIDPIEMGMKKEAMAISKEWMQENPDADLSSKQVFDKAYSVVKEGYQEDLQNNVQTLEQGQSVDNSKMETPDQYKTGKSPDDYKTGKTPDDYKTGRTSEDYSSQSNSNNEQQSHQNNQQNNSNQNSQTQNNDGSEKSEKTFADKAKKRQDQLSDLYVRSKGGLGVIDGADRTMDAVGIDADMKGIREGTVHAKSTIGNAHATIGDVADGANQANKAKEALDSMKEEGINRQNSKELLKGVENTAKEAKQGMYNVSKSADRILGKDNAISDNLDDAREAAHKVDRASDGTRRVTKGIFKLLGGKSR